MKNIIIVILIILAGVVGYSYLSSHYGASNQNEGIDMNNSGEVLEEDLQAGNNFEGTHCYQYNGIDAGTRDSRVLRITIQGAEVTGTKKGYSGSKEYSIGYEGSLEGTIKDNAINTITTLSLSDGGDITQEERYVISDNSITELRYVLEEDFSAGILRIDDTQTQIEEQVFPIRYEYQKVSCNNDFDIDAITYASEYICFKADEGENTLFQKVMFALDEDERAIYAQYRDNGKDRINDLAFVSRDIPNPGSPGYTLTYHALLPDGAEFGTYTQTHSGNYDYLIFTDSDGKVFNFTNIPEESYVTSSCL